MPTYPVRIEGFSGTRAGLNGERVLDVSKARTMKFAASVGLPMLVASTPRSSHAISLAAYKAIAIRCAIDFSGSRLLRPVEYELMDPSEKGNISYWIGMTTAALLSNDLLDAPRMLHAAGFATGRVTRKTPGSRRLADLVGQQRDGSWHVVEAKARQGEPSDTRRMAWKTQATTIATIDGVQPATQSYVLAKIGRRCAAELIDPSADDEETGIRDKRGSSQRASIITERIASYFYEPLREWLGQDAVSVIRPEMRLRVRIAAYDGDTAEYVYLGLSEEALDVTGGRRLPALAGGVESDDAYLGGDGFALLLSPRIQAN